jgi:hypothetical protein
MATKKELQELLVKQTEQINKLSLLTEQLLKEKSEKEKVERLWYEEQLRKQEREERVQSIMGGMKEREDAEFRSRWHTATCSCSDCQIKRRGW